MQLIIHGQQAFGKSVLESVFNRGKDKVVAVYCAPDTGTRMDPLKEFALERNLPVYQPESYKDPEVWEQMRSHGADLCVMAYVTLFVPEEALHAPRLGSIQYHPSLLPLHKGPSSINWPIIFGEAQTGLSIFWPDNGLDTGPILLQKEVEIGPDDTLGSLYFNSLFPMGVDAMMEAVELVRGGNAPKVVQDPAAGTYEGWCRKADVEVDWAKPAAEIYNLIRGANPQPGAWSSHNGAEFKIFDCVKSNASGPAGEVVAATADSFTVAAADGGIEIQKLRPEGGGKMTASDYINQSGLAVGDKLG